MDVAVGRGRRLPVRPGRDRARTSTPSTRRRRPSAARCTSDTCFSYTHTDVIARFQRMCGKAVFYPMGWDDNGLPTERRVQNYYGVRCDPSLPYDPAFTPPDKPGKQAISDLAAELHRSLHAPDARGREGVRGAVALARLVGGLVDDLRDDQPRLAARLAARVPAVAREATWRISSKRRRCGTWISARRSPRPSSRIASSPAPIHRLRFARTDGGFVEIDTTRPELIPACVALVAHPDDDRYRPLFGRHVKTSDLRRPRSRRSRTGWRTRRKGRASR